MSEIIVKLTGDHIKLKGGEYVQDLVKCKECKHNYNTAINHGKMQPRCDFMDAKLSADDFCSYGEREGE